MSRMPFASIIVPTYNQAAFLEQALDSLLSQVDPDWEAIVVNDGSTDNTQEIIAEYARRDRRILSIHKPNGGVASALNAGLSNARGVWIHWLSSDDMFEPDKLAINRQWIEQHPNKNFFFSYFTLLSEATGSKERRDLWGPLPDPNHQILTLFYRNYVSGISICVNRQAWERVGFFDESLRYAQDYDQWLRLLQNNQGLFIPEWTVISRNHAAQGSETFPEACYFDTAKAAIRFINQHHFQELVPWADLSDNLSAQKAVAYALDVACDHTAFLYRLGYHPSLALRVLEWVFSAQCSDLALKSLVSTRIAEMSFTDVDDDWGWMWRQLAVAINPRAGNFRYEPTDPVQLALREYRSLKNKNDERHEPLHDYLVRFEGVTPEETNLLENHIPRIVILLEGSSEPAELFDAMELLGGHGFRLVCLIEEKSKSAITWEECKWGRIIRVAAFDHDTLPWLGEVELAITMPGIVVPTWLDGLSHLELNEGQSATDIERCVLDALGMGSDTQPRPVVFLERVLWGGGAERVVLDLAKHIDRRRYRPIILTMFDEHIAPPQIPPHIERGRCFEPALSQQQSPLSPTQHKPSIKHLMFSTLHRSYLSLLPAEVRTKVKLGQRLLRLYQNIQKIFTVTNRWQAPVGVAQEPRQESPLSSAQHKPSIKHLMFSTLHRSYSSLLPAEVRTKVKLGQRLLRLYQNIQKVFTVTNRWQAPVEVTQEPRQEKSLLDDKLSLDYVNTAIHHNSKVVGLLKATKSIRSNMVLISVMEEAAITAWLAQAGFRFPYIVSLHSLESLCMGDIFPVPARRRAESRLLAAACNDALTVTFPSQGCCDDLSQNFAIIQEKLRKIWNPVNCASIRRQSFQPDKRSHHWRKTAPGFRMVQVGRLDQQKNHDLLLEACVELKRRGKGFSLVIVGDGYDRLRIEQLIHSQGLQDEVFLVGEQKNPFPWIAAADALLLTSRYEAFSLVLAEAMICGTPVVSVDCPTGPSEVLNKGEYGLLVANNNPFEFAIAIERLMNDPLLAQRLSDMGYKRAQTFDVKMVVPQWQALIDSMPLGQVEQHVN